MGRLPETIESDRLTMHRWVHGDGPVLDRAITDSVEHLRPWMPWIQFEPATPDERESLIDRWQTEWEQGGDAVYGVFLLDGTCIGGCGLHRRSGPAVLEIGYWIHVDHVRRGYATELARALTGAALAIDGIDVVEITHDGANEASGRVPAALGYELVEVTQREPEAPGESGTFQRWAITRDTWPP